MDSPRCRFVLSYPWRTEQLRYVRTLEGCLIDGLLRAGKVGLIRSQPLLPKNNTYIADLLGENHTRLERITVGADLFRCVEAGQIHKSRYFQLMMSDIRTPQPKAVVRKAKKVYKLYKKFLSRGGMVPEGSKWTLADYPMSITYRGYQHNQDGTHRRMILYALGHRDCQTLTVAFEDIDMSTALPYLKEKHKWFQEQLLGGPT